MRIIKFFVIFLIIFGWIFSGWPRIWQNPPFPQKIKRAEAVWDVPKIGTIVTVAAAVGNITLTEPTNIAQGDLMVATIAAKSNYPFTLPAGWALVATQQSSGDVDSTAGVASGVMAYIVRGASAPDLTFTRNALADVGFGRITAYVGGFTAPYDTGSSATTLASVTPTTASITTAQAGELLVAMVACGDSYLTSAFDAVTDPTTASGATNTTTAPTAGTWLERSDTSTTIGADTALATADAIRETAGLTGTLQATVATAAGHVLIVGAFKLAVVPTVSTQAATLVEATTATGNGTIITTGGATTRRGFAYIVGTSGDPTTADSVAYDDGFFPTGAYTKGLTGLTSGTNYRVRAYVVNSTGTGYGTTVQILTKPAAPTAFNFTSVAATTLRLNWTASTGAASYKVERCTGTGCSSWLEIAIGVATAYYDDTGRTGNTVYRYQVRAINATGDGAYSSGAEQLMLPDVPSMPTFSGVAATSVTVNWNAPTGGAASYKVERAPDSGGAPGSWTEVGAGVTSPWINNTGLTCGTTYWYKVRGTNATGDGSYSGNNSQTTGSCNTAPTFSGNPTDSPDPVVAGYNVAFSGTAADSESNSWYLAICKTNSITAGSPPACDTSQTYCVSISAVASGSSNSCTWTSSGSTAQNWYAFACDNNASPLCSSANIVNSPITVNAVVVSVSVSPATTNYGIMAVNEVKKAGTANANNEFIVTNAGNVAEDFDIISGNAIGGAGWTLSTTAVGSSIFMHAYSALKTLAASFTLGSVGQQATNWVAMDNAPNYRALVNNVAVGGTVDLVLELLSPSGMGDLGVSKDIIVTIRATQH